MHDHDKEKRKEHNLFVRNGKFEVELAQLRWTFCTIEA